MQTYNNCLLKFQMFSSLLPCEVLSNGMLKSTDIIKFSSCLVYNRLTN